MMPSDIKHDTEENRDMVHLVQSLQNFGLFDYSIFVAMLVFCSGVGVFFGLKSNKKLKSSTDNRRGSVELDYIVGNRKMNVYPVAMSLIASAISGTSFLGTATEGYLYGTSFLFINFGKIICGLLVNFIFLPVFMDLKLTSMYEYLEARFNKKTRLLGAILFSLGALVKLPIMIYVPALAFNQVAGVNIHIVTTVTCVVCIFYTSIGGIKAVVLTDAVQIVIMYVTSFTIIIVGVYNLGGIETVIDRNTISGRIEPPLNSFSFLERHTLLSLIFGGSFYYTQLNAISQCYVQRYLSLPSLKAARQALWIYIVGIIIISSCGNFNGLLIYAKYHDCDPLTTKLAPAKDQLLPLYIMEIFYSIPGLPGIFIAGVFSATLSSLSTSLNSLSAIFIEDFIKPHVSHPLSQRLINRLLRSVVLVYGVLSVVLVLVVQKLGSVLQLSMTLHTVANGPLFGIFIIGLMIPWINAKSATIGGYSALLIMSWIAVKSQLMSANGEIKFDTKPVSVDGCMYNYTMSKTLDSDPIPQEKTIYHLSYLWYAFAGASLCIIIASISSFIFGWNEPDEVDVNLLAPFVRRFVNKGEKTVKVIEFNESDNENTKMDHKLIVEE